MEFYNEENTKEALKGLIKIGEVSSVDYAKCTARVVFDDDDSIVSDDLPVLQTNTFRNKDHAMPDIGEDVICLFLPSGGEEGFILGSIYAGEVAPTETSPHVRSVTFADGTTCQYNRETHELKAVINDTVIIADRSHIDIKAPNTIDNSSKEINTKGEMTVNVEGGTTVNVKAGATINLVAPSVNLTMGSTTMKLNGSSASIDAQNLELKGALKVTGNVTTSGNITASGSVHGSNIN